MKTSSALRCLAAVTFAVAFKVWITSRIQILAGYAPHDDSNFLEHALSIVRGHWFGPYNQYTLIKQPFFPIYLAGVARSHLSLTTAHVLLDLVVCAVTCVAIRPLVSSLPWLIAIFVTLFFDPFSFDANAWRTQRSQINPELALVSVSCAYAMYLRSGRTIREVLPWAVGLGVSFSAFWLTREEAAWLLPAVFLPLVGFLARRRRLGPTAAMIPGVMVATLPILITAAGVGVVMLINGLVYGWYTTNERQAPEFVSAVNALTRIDVQKPRGNQLPGLARRIAYRVSPAAREIRPALDGPVGLAWHNMSPAPCGADPTICSPLDVGTAFVAWSLRDAVAATGHYSSGDAARRYYLALGREIDAACDSRAIACKPRWQIAVPFQLADTPDVLTHLAAGTTTLFTLSTLSFDPLQIGPPDPALRADYERVVRSVALGDADVAKADTSAGYQIARAGGTAYQQLTPGLLVLSAMFFLARLVRVIVKRRITPKAQYLMLFVSCGVSIAILLLLLAAIDTLAFPAFSSEYLGQMVPLVFSASLLTVASESSIALRLLRRHLPAAEPRRLSKSSAL